MECYTTGRQVGSVKRSRWPRRQWASDRELSNLERLLGDWTNPAKTWNHRQWLFGLQVDVKSLSAPMCQTLWSYILVCWKCWYWFAKEIFSSETIKCGKSSHPVWVEGNQNWDLAILPGHRVDSVFVLRKCGGNDGASVPPTKTIFKQKPSSPPASSIS